MLFDHVFQQFPAELRPGSVERPAGAAGFSGARILRVHAPAGTFCLRQWPVDAPPPQRLAGLHRLLAWVRDAGVASVAVPVPTNEGRTFLEAGNRVWQLEPWMPGTADFRQNPSPARLRAAGETLARWHTAAARFPCRDDERAWFDCGTGSSPGLTRRLELLRNWTDDRLGTLEDRVRFAPPPWTEPAHRLVDALRGSRARLTAELDRASRLRVPLQPCLRDVWHDHVLFTGDRVSGLIDPAAARTETVAGDIARLFGSLVYRPRVRVAGAAPLSSDARSALSCTAGLQAYETVRPLSETERHLFRLFDESGVLLSGLNWLERILLRGEPGLDDPRILQRVVEFADRAASTR